MGNEELVDVRKATHVKVGGQVKMIVSKFGIDENGHLAKPFEGGFGVVTEDGQLVDMWHAQSYLHKG